MTAQVLLIDVFFKKDPNLNAVEHHFQIDLLNVQSKQRICSIRS